MCTSSRDITFIRSLIYIKWDGGQKDLGREEKTQRSLRELSTGTILQKSQKCILNAKKVQLKMSF